jgi:hypothetical protein
MTNAQFMAVKSTLNLMVILWPVHMIGHIDIVKNVISGIKLALSMVVRRSRIT